MGIAVVGETDDPPTAAERLSWDVAAFDQRGCLSPRLVIFAGRVEGAARLAEALHRELMAREADVPRGQLDQAEMSEALLYIRSVQMTGRCWTFNAGAVGLHDDASVALLPPPGRHVGIVCATALPPWISRLGPSITTVGRLDERLLMSTLASSIPWARVAELGRMQRPPLDGPVDRRTMIRTMQAGVLRGENPL
jgi:hypothetical protein